MKKDIKIGDTVYVSGEVYYGNKWYRVASNGVVQDIRTKSMLITVDFIDGDGNATVIVNKKYINEISSRMLYVDALKLINLSIEHGLIKEMNGMICVYRNAGAESEEGWYLDDKYSVAQELMDSEEGQKIAIKALKKKGIDFMPTDLSLNDTYKDNLKGLE